MNIQDLHQEEKPLSAKKFFTAQNGDVLALHILKDEQLKEHSTKTPALLVCILGEVTFENKEGMKVNLLPGNYVNIEPLIPHWVTAVQESDLLLIK